MISTVQQPEAGLLGLPPRKKFIMHNFWAHYCLLKYDDFSKQPLLLKEYAKKNMAVPISIVKRCVTELPNMATVRRFVEHSFWIVVALFCAMGYTSDIRLWTGETTPTAAR